MGNRIVSEIPRLGIEIRYGKIGVEDSRRMGGRGREARR